MLSRVVEPMAEGLSCAQLCPAVSLLEQAEISSLAQGSPSLSSQRLPLQLTAANACASAPSTEH